jgi:hypothetical protein
MKVKIDNQEYNFEELPEDIRRLIIIISNIDKELERHSFLISILEESRQRHYSTLLELMKKLPKT